MTYEEMKENPEASVLKLASFIDEEKYAKPLREDPEKLQAILKYSSFKHMKETVNKGFEELFSMSEEEVLKSDLPEAMKKMITAKIPKEVIQEKPPAVNFIRKGITGDWKNYFNEDQSKRLEKKFAERTKGTDLPNLWKNYM
ncbi:hypothetical protein AVEN_136419-1 [Araneus ventricosus]|uniref:Sulfotransferase domain-containing protein n=2 Tax=Araneus ventricosus TaxID=182803 RepID=A0A4Y2SZ79_ARAVE|nr:hypothetical protein AVEN_156955-1 [Araneus ventricosus]GBN92459.1 hypothetical protein AVEN_136419-1 [Araneus ventricosus]